jgi:hypothetical protein
MQAVIETPAYLASASGEGLAENERTAIVSALARNPAAGDLDAGHRRRTKGQICRA